ncbi:MAG: 2-oxoacid ferredoxin oxidoreductase, subunit beta [Candidatus Roizmanbacteria bacterium GW2011_GWA2_37_7]|uniref:2-oxoacid ferredoxin oxidoreductase, subunit beta n=1 Tax=Candidatus Roizmanbacteria bacterium GW2011_GWA2_37_7 TaxID=1618481 RepID=A0A0G0HIA6_9BACT|nr:MAG: 2-oxoacid ferredoxin oxidoreductase, subunit beta [Candidatus Roizmanbacteria bacterium GW2011_GWA2_37_7]
MSDITFDGYAPTWCPGCGDWGIRVGIKTALEQLGYDPSTIFLSFDIGCSGNMNDFLNGYAAHGLHGRAIPTAVGMKTAHHEMKTIVIGGDGGIYGEGGNHFIHACRGNHDITVIVHDNMVYGLTTGQVAPTAKQGFKSKSTPRGIIEIPVNPLALAISQGATFVSQGFAGDVRSLIEIMKAAISHKGFSLVNILQPCVTFNKINTYQYFLKNTHKLKEDYKPNDKKMALMKSMEVLEEKFPIGILYKEDKAAYHERIPQLETPLVSRQRYADFEPFTSEFV